MMMDGIQHRQARALTATATMETVDTIKVIMATASAIPVTKVRVASSLQQNRCSLAYSAATRPTTMVQASDLIESSELAPLDTKLVWHVAEISGGHL